MNYDQTIDYLFNKLPMYQRIGGAAYKADLSNTLRLCELLNHPEEKFRSVHIAGTNGKGSTSHLLASILQEAGLKTGLYTSPHYTDFRERIKINGQMIPETLVTNFIEKFRQDFEAIGLSFFEMTVGLAFDWFAQEAVDIAIIETGLGGRLDSTNVLTPLVSVITNIGMDHMRFLGDTLSAIAREKAGIIKPGIPVVIGESQDEVMEEFLEKATRQQAPISFADQNRKIEALAPSDGYNPIRILTNDQEFLNISQFPLFGSFQRRNLATALETISKLKNDIPEISNESIQRGVSNVIVNTGLKGRWQILQKNPLVIADSGHNREGIRQVVENINQTPHNKLHMVFGMVNDKDISTILKMLPASAEYYFCKADIPRGLDASELSAQAADFGLMGKPYESVNAAYEAAKNNSTANDLIFIGGSTFVVAEVV